MLVFVAALLAVALLVDARDQAADRPDATSTAAPSTPTPLPTSTRGSAFELQPGSVCQGSFIRPTPGAVRQFSPQYTQFREALGIAIVGGPAVSPDALDAAEATVRLMFQHNDLEDALAEVQAYVIVAEPNQDVLDLPEFSCLEGRTRPNTFERVCGVADRANYPVVTVNALDLLGDSEGPCGGLNILFHELGHMVQTWSVSPADYFDARLLHHDAISAGLYSGEYASLNFREYWAEGTQAFFLSADSSGVRDRDWLRTYDPALYSLMTLVFGEGGD